MAGIDLSDLGATPVTPSSDNKMDFSDLGATPAISSTDDAHKYFTNGTFDDAKFRAAQSAESGPDREEAALRGAAQGATLGTQPMTSPLLERFYAKLFGDDQTKQLYNNLSNDDLKKTYVEQNQAAMQAHPDAYVGGQVLGSLPAALATGGAASEAAGAAGLGKVGTALLNGAGQAATQGTLGAVQGYNANPLASDADRLANAEKVGGTSAALAGPLAAAAPFVPTLARTAGTAALGAGIGSVFGHPGIGAAVGAGAGYIPAIGEDLMGENGFLGYGTKGVKLGTNADNTRIESGISDLAGKVSNSIGNLDQKVTGPAIEQIQNTYQGALESLTKDLNATPEQAAQIVQSGQSSAINKLESLMQAAQEQGKTVSTGNVIQALTEQLKQDISSSGTVIGDVDRKTVENAVQNLNGYLTKKGMPINIKSSTILNSEGKPFLSNLQVSGKNLTADEVKDLLNPETGQLDAAKIQALGGPNAQVNPLSSSVKTTQMSGNNPESQLIPNTAMPPPSQQIPMGEISPEQLETMTAMQRVPGEEPDTSARPMFTQIDAKQQVVPQEPQSGEMSVPEAQNLKRLLGKMGYDSSSIPDEVKGSFINANQDLNKIITNAFQPSEEGAVNPYADVNAKLTAIHDLGKLVGVPTKLYSTGQQIPSATLQNIIKGVGTSLTDADNGKFQQVVKLLSVLDPEGAQSFQNNVKNFGGQLAELKAAGSNPLEQQSALSNQGLNTPVTDEAALNIKKMNTIKNTAGGPSSDIDDAGNSLPSDKTYDFIKSLNKLGKNSSTEAAESDPLDNTIELLRKYDPDLVDTLETQGKDLARQSELQDTQGISGRSIWSRPYYALKGAIGTGVNRAGVAYNAAASNPVTSPFFKALPTMIKASAPILGKYGPALASAYQRGDSALTATNYTLMQSDPQYRMLNDQFNEKFQ